MTAPDPLDPLVLRSMSDSHRMAMERLSDSVREMESVFSGIRASAGGKTRDSAFVRKTPEPTEVRGPKHQYPVCLTCCILINTRCDHIYHRGESAYNTVNCAQCGTAVDSSTCCLITAPREHVLYNFRAQTVPPTTR